MNRLLSANLKVWHLLVCFAAVVALGIGSVVMARPLPLPPIVGSTGGVTPAAFLPTGAFQMIVADSNTGLTVRAADGLVSVLSTDFTVPAGKRVDIASFFNAEAYKYANGYCYVEFHLDSLTSTALRPGQLWVADGYIYKNAYPTMSAQSFRQDIHPGLHKLIVSIFATTNSCYVGDRSLIVMANTHT